MRSILSFMLALALAGCAARLPTHEATVALAAPRLGSESAGTPARDLETRFVRCETEGMTRELEVERAGFDKNKLALFIGFTAERGEEGGQTIGLDYVRRFSESWAANAFVDFAAGGIDSRVIGVGVSFYPVEWVAVFAGPGIEWVDGESQGLVRVGLALEFEVGEHVAIGPAACVDLLEDGEQAWSLGACLVYGF